MAQTLLIGLGGTGSRVVNNVVRELHKNNKRINDGEICCAVLDTNVNDNASIEDSNTGVPVIGTSKAKKIRDYFVDHHHLHMEQWCPQSPAFMEQSMIDGASELRLKSRIAFMDSLETDVIERLELMINDVLEANTGSKIRVMIVSSLSGGTGSGMFIQVALWLRKFLSESEITIRGIFMLPDVFVSTVRDIRENKTTKVRHYCNAYAAIRELNAITKIKMTNSVELAEKISIDGLFDSQTDADSGNPVFDFAFFVDDRDENGVRLESIGAYERMVAQLVYMQLYAPMKDDMYSEEDNAFISYISNDEPLFGSCGTAKAVYPVDSVKTYCALRAAKDSLTGGWRKIDGEIDELIAEKKERENDGVFSNEVIEPRVHFVRLFDEKTSVKEDEAGRDRFFTSIAKDTKNESKVKSDGKTVVKFSDKVEDFIKLIKLTKIDTLVTSKGGTDEFALNEEAFVQADHTKQYLADKIKSDESGLSEVLDDFDAKLEEYADGIVNSVFPYSMGDVKPSNRCTIYGLLTKQDEQGAWNFIHPVAARYILYKLVAQMERSIKDISLKDSREEALAGGDVSAIFDNKATSETETSAEQLLNSKKWYQSEGTFLDDFERRYAQFITGKIELCDKYQKEALQVTVFRKMIERLNGLIKQFEAFFKRLDEVQEKLDAELAENVQETNGVVGKTVYIYGSAEEKEDVYSKLDFELDKSNVQINKSVIDAIYGRVCAEKRPSNPENAAYMNVSVITAFVMETIRVFRGKIENDANNKDLVELDIYSALCRASDAEYVRKGGKITQGSDIGDLDVSTGTVKANNDTAQRHHTAFIACKDRLHRMAAPFLIYTKEQSDNALGTVTTRPKIFWGFSPAIADAYPGLGQVLGVNEELQADEAYPKNELYCYRAVYGLEAANIPKFNELSGGDYYTCYEAVVSEMVADADGRQGARALVRTPHLDMRWHKLLPYISPEKRKQADMEFFHGFWLAVATGKIKTNKDGELFVVRSIDGGFGNFEEEEIAILHKDKPVTKTDVVKLIEVLRTDKVFSGTDIPKLEGAFKEVLEDLDTYVSTDVYKGLTTKNEDLNPINIVSRYNESAKRDKYVAAALIGALEKIAEELVLAYDAGRSPKQLEEAKYRLCRRIYDSSKRTKGKSFGSWEAAFEKFKITKEGGSGKKSAE